MPRHPTREVRVVKRKLNAGSSRRTTSSGKLPGSRCDPAGGRGFTLLEVVLAIGLCGAVMALLATAIDLYLVRIDTSRTQVETAQLARTLLNKIADDLRAVRYSAPGGAVPPVAGADSEGETASDGAEDSSGLQPTSSTELGIFGTLTELRIDRAAARSWRQVTVPATDVVVQADPHDMPQTVEYFFEEGRVLTSADLAAGGVGDNSNLSGYTGLYRRQTPTAALMLLSSNTMGGGAMTESQEPAELLAPEIVQISFMYSDGVEWYEEWDSAVQQSLPAAVEIKVSLFSDVLGTEPAQRELDEEARRRDQTRWVEHRLVVRIPKIDEPQEVSGPASPTAEQSPPVGDFNAP